MTEKSPNLPPADTRSVVEIESGLDGKSLSDLSYDEMIQKLPGGSDNEEVAAIMRAAKEKQNAATGQTPEGIPMVQTGAGEIMTEESYADLSDDDKVAAAQVDGAAQQ